MILNGSCNAETFAVNKMAGTPYRSGIATTAQLREYQVKEGWVVRVTTPFVRLWNQGEYGNVVLWEYLVDLANPNPYFWSIYDANTHITHFWESENYPDDVVDIGTSPIVFDTPQDRVPPGGGSIRSYLPGHTDLESIETTVAAASTPSWVTGTSYSTAPNNALLLSRLFIAKQNERGMFPYSNLAAIKNLILDSRFYNWYYMLWLRSASQILYNHRSETMVPLVSALIKVDTTTGYLSLL